MLREIENTLLRMCHDRTEPTDEECNEAVDADYLPAYKPLKEESARVTMSSSISLLSRWDLGEEKNFEIHLSSGPVHFSFHVLKLFLIGNYHQQDY